MCGIFGYTGRKQVKPILLHGLSMLEYRGYDSAGICVEDHGVLQLCKGCGRVEQLGKKAGKIPLSGTCGIGHTRWATHGAATEKNAHPHLSEDGRFAVVHNGIIENCHELRRMLTEQGFFFRSDTDTEVVSHLLQYYYQGDIKEALTKTIGMLSGSYALGVVSSYAPGIIFATAKDSPLFVAEGVDEAFLSSDAMAFPFGERKVYLPEAGEIAILTGQGVSFSDPDGGVITKTPEQMETTPVVPDKSGYDFYMLKEIMEQPFCFKRMAQADMKQISRLAKSICSLQKIHIVACGSAYHAGLAGKRYFESIAGLFAEVEPASEFRYRSPEVPKGELVIAISQSGETADTIAALRHAKACGMKTLSVVNVHGSTLAREADAVIYTDAGPEIAVATTKGYTSQVISMFLLGVHFARQGGKINEVTEKNFELAMRKLPEKTEKVLNQAEEIRKVSKKIKSAKHVFFMGRGADADVAAEGALKLKEITYIHAEAYVAGELKHGTISLIEKGTPVIAVATQKSLYTKMRSNIQEVKARGAFVIAVTPDTQIGTEADCVLDLPDTEEHLSAIPAAVSLQLLAYYTAVEKGLDADKPRNLAKSVTVE